MVLSIGYLPWLVTLNIEHNKNKFNSAAAGEIEGGGIRVGTSRRAAVTGPWSCEREPALAVSPHAGNSPWRKKGNGRERAAGRGRVPAGERERRAGLTPPALLRFP
ncbi:MAG: hypothetical protein FD150_1748 [Rhodobacteraceae bacterium]|nr:MAG: hypothetical protein FD150_1748 [Paracoccaceae bacterium]